MTERTEQEARDGYDSAICLQAEDKLDRWKFARELYGVAVTGPPEWSVRIGIYGEWGTGKSSVLKMIETMARDNGHVVVWFDPWEYSSKDTLWRSFVLAVFDELKKRCAVEKEADAAKQKAWFSKAQEVVTSVAKALNENAGNALDVGLNLLRKHFSFSRADLDELGYILGESRIIVLIDDLDRTAMQLVPEILFALKELMDIPRFAFLCAFDPIVVGKALKRHHEGFEDGLKFLEKIIDYPRWLPEPSNAGLARLAEADVAEHCEYVPLDALPHAVSLLPRNPRAVRQFVRLLRLLKDQVARHYDYELAWPTILAANVLKIRYPKYAPGLLGSDSFWKEISTIALMHDNDEEEKRKESIEKHLVAVLPDEAAGVGGEDRKSIAKAITQLAKQVSPWTERDEKSLSYQMNIAEAPAAVTWKEFDEFLEAWRGARTPEAADKWISDHARLFGRQYNDVYRELLDAAVRARQSALGKAADTIANADANPDLQKANDLMDVLRCLAIDLGKLDQKEKRLNDQDLKQCLEALMYYVGWTANDTYRSMRQREKALLVDMARSWEHDLSAWLNALKPFSGFMEHEFRGKEAKAVYDELLALIMPKFALMLLDGLRSSGFVDSVYSRSTEQSFEIRGVLLDVNGPLWKGLRAECLSMLRTGISDAAVQQNSYAMFYWCNYLLRKEAGFDEAAKMTELMKDDEIRNALWAAATSQPLSFRATASIRELPEALKNQGIALDPPEWWEPVLAEGGLTSTTGENSSSAESDDQEGENT
jgi:hypothetical protein